MSDPDQSPDPTEVEISLFGPGYGESAVLHVGNGSWVIVDSCTHPDLSLPTPLHYLAEMGVDPSTAVKAVIATHWHDDHISGISSILDACVSATFVCSNAFLTEEFMTVLEVYAHSDVFGQTGVDELRKSFDIVEGSGRHVRLASAGRIVWRQSGNWATDGFPCEIQALAPSDTAITTATKAIANTVCQLGPQCRAPVLTKNRSTVVLWVKLGGEAFLLGGDLEEKNCGGWTLLLDEFAEFTSDGCVFKVPHHDSVTAEHPEVWASLLQPQPYALLSPFILGSNRLPTPADVTRICGYTKNSYITASPAVRGRRRRRPPAVERTMKESMSDAREVVMSQGHVRLRMVPGHAKSKRVDLLNGAVPLSRAWN